MEVNYNENGEDNEDGEEDSEEEGEENTESDEDDYGAYTVASKEDFVHVEAKTKVRFEICSFVVFKTYQKVKVLQRNYILPLDLTHFLVKPNKKKSGNPKIRVTTFNLKVDSFRIKLASFIALKVP